MKVWKKGTALNEEERSSILLLALKNYSINGISKELGIPSSRIRTYFTKWNPENYKKISIYLNGKKEPYHHNEDDYANLPTYKWDDLCSSEIEAYNQYRVFKQD